MTSGPAYQLETSQADQKGGTVKKKKKKRERERGNCLKMESLVLSPMLASQNAITILIVISASPRNVTFTLSVWNYLASLIR